MTGTNGQQNQQVNLDPQSVIDALLARVQQLTMECAMKDAYIAQLQKETESAPEPVP